VTIANANRSRVGLIVGILGFLLRLVFLLMLSGLGREAAFISGPS
jgi:hypothetical protein